MTEQPPALRREPKEALPEIIDNMIPILEPLGDLTKMSKVFGGRERELDTSLVHLVVIFDNKREWTTGIVRFLS